MAGGFGVLVLQHPTSPLLKWAQRWYYKNKPNHLQNSELRNSESASVAQSVSIHRRAWAPEAQRSEHSNNRVSVAPDSSTLNRLTQKVKLGSENMKANPCAGDRNSAGSGAGKKMHTEVPHRT